MSRKMATQCPGRSNYADEIVMSVYGRLEAAAVRPKPSP